MDGFVILPSLCSEEGGTLLGARNSKAEDPPNCQRCSGGYPRNICRVKMNQPAAG